MPNHMHRRPKSRLRRELRRVRISRRARYTALAAVVLLAGLTAGFCLGRSGAPASGTSPVSPIDGVAVRADAAEPEPLFGRAGRSIDGVPFYSQIGEFPTGCEGVSAAMLLGYYGMEISPGEFIDGFLPLGDAPYETDDGQWAGCDPWTAFPGDPRSEYGWGCYSTVIEGALNAFLSDTEYRAERFSGVSLDSLCAEYIDNGDPVLVWATIDMDPPHTGLTWTVPETGQEITWIGPMHCLVLIGYDDTGYIFNDPLAGEAVHYERAAVEEAYEALYAQAVVLETE